ncbi:caffeate O-methyltransferase 1, O-methyltransferase 1, O-methyltransferase 3 [Hibiscus trionum]|uniref:Caffeate O-methyltransferase 1, O-methyltransferase 1, O-methyltransferase 3 n=1 Tax=Hibiscus trionum TaxID=183268 RepID=A0A9W7ILW9_HIBTR|nr:caffeate O-methyltransferase 1, O-methyltransferase 1, O-methyltransferase 3 [Hibiscus trionum]
MGTSTETQLNGTGEESLVYALQVVNSLVLPMSMHAAVQLDVFEIIAKAGPDAKLSSKEIVARLPTKNPEAPSMLDRVLRVLASHGIVGCSVADDEKGDPQRLYSLTPVSKFFVRNEDGVSLGPLMALLQDKIFIDSWSQLKDAIIEGGVPFDRVHGMNAFEYPGTDPRFNQVYNTALINHTTLVLKKILDSYNGFEQIGCLVDVGGGLGIALSLITSKYPSIKGINFDLPHVIQHAPAYPGVEHVGGDMFESVPKGDTIFMKWIFPCWSNDHCVKLLKNCYNATPEDGKVVVVEAVVPVVPEANAYSRGTTQWDVLMLTRNLGGKERTKREFEALAKKAGFSGIRYECFVCNLWVMEIFK